MSIILVLLIVGVVMAMLPIDAQIRNIIYVILVVFLIVWLFGLLGHGPVLGARIV